MGLRRTRERPGRAGRLSHLRVGGRAASRPARWRGPIARDVQRLPASHVHDPGRRRQQARDRLSLSRLELQSRRIAARRAGDGFQSRILQGGLSAAADPLRGVARLGHGDAQQGCAARVRAARRSRGIDRRLPDGELCRDVPRVPRLGHQLEGPRREFHGELSLAGLSRPARSAAFPSSARWSARRAAAPSTITRF